MHQPLLTIGISFYNNAYTLEDLVKCIFAQTFQDWELIFIDDGSTDGGVRIIEKITDLRVRIICDGKNLGRSVRYNQITDMARGEYVARFDADDLSMPDRFEKLVLFMGSHPEIDVVSSDMLSVDENEEVKGRRYNPVSHDEICANPLNHVYLAHGPMVARKEWLIKHKYPEQYRIAIDYALLLSSYKDSHFASIPEPLYIYREYITHSFKKYVKTSFSVTRIIWAYGRRTHNIFRVMFSIFLCYIRVVIYMMITVLGLQQKLIDKRSNKASESEKQLFKTAMQKIRAIEVPGLTVFKTGLE